MLKAILNQNKQLFLFLAKFGGILLAWQVLYIFFFKDKWIDIFVTKSIALISQLILAALNYPLALYDGPAGAQLLYYQNKALLLIAHNCNGLILYILFIAFLVSINIGSLKQKISAIFIGVVALFLINCFRVIALILTEIHAPEYTDFSHKYLYTLIVYAFELWFWMLLINRWSKQAAN